MSERQTRVEWLVRWGTALYWFDYEDDARRFAASLTDNVRITKRTITEEPINDA